MLLILLSCSVSAVVSALLCILIGPKLIRRYSKPLSLIAVGFLITLAVTHIIPEAMEESDPHKIGMVILFSMLFLYTFVFFPPYESIIPAHMLFYRSSFR